MTKKSKCFFGFNPKVHYALEDRKKVFPSDLMDYYLDVLAQIIEPNLTDSEAKEDATKLIRYISCCFHDMEKSIDMTQARRDLSIDKILNKYEKE